MHLAPHLTAVVVAGGYISAWKLLPVVLLVFLWARWLVWVDKDAPVARLPREWINLGFWAGLVVALLAFFLLPGFWIAIAFFTLLLIIEVGLYLALRHAQVGLADLVEQLKNLRPGAGPTSATAAQARSGDVVIVAADQSALPVPRREDPRRAGYDAFQALVADPLRKEAQRIELTPGEDAAVIRFVVDGVSHPGRTLSRPAAAAVIAFCKNLCALNPDERRKPQRGALRVILDSKTHELEITAAGSATGESLRIAVDTAHRFDLKLDDLGFAPGQLTAVKASIADAKGVVLVASPRGQGLTTTLYGLLRGHDAYLSHMQTIERRPDGQIDGITQNALPPNAAPNDEVKLVSWILSQEPDVVMISQIDDPRSAAAAAQFAATGRRVYVGMRALNALDALAQWRKFLGDDPLAMGSLRMVVASRVLRRLCPACKIGFSPDADALRKLNLNPARAGQLFAARKEPLRNARGSIIPCQFCHDLRYHGLLGVYEVLAVDDDVRQVVAAGGSSNQVRVIFRKQRGMFLQEAALARVESGDTSIHEVLRVLQLDQPAATAKAPAGAAPGHR